MKTKFLLLIVFFGISALIFRAHAQYDVTSLDGSWFLQLSEEDPYDDNLMYIVFDGQGNIIAISGFCESVSGTYTVSESGAISATLNCDEELIPFSGQFTSANHANMDIDEDVWNLNKIVDLGAMAIYLTGTLTTETCGTKDIQLTLNSEGIVIASSGLDEQVSGRVYAQDGLFIGHIYTGASDGWGEFSIMGYYDSFYNQLTGQLGLDWSGCGTTAVNLIRSNSTEVSKPTTSLMAIFPNPANDIINIICLESGKLNVYNLTGSLVTTFDLEKGEHKINTDVFSNGIYIFEMNYYSFSQRQKIIVQK